ncbi:MAG TPA: hypothetical protein VFG73_02370 [Rhodanobacteraceae bacterium]|nr:hypothetical protein [Rhodanobacteraceae bacterium]
MTAHLNDLLVATLRRAGKPLASDELLDAAVAGALDHGWVSEQLTDLGNRRNVAARLTNLRKAGHVEERGRGVDEQNRRTTPLWAPVAGFDRSCEIPPPPVPGASELLRSATTASTKGRCRAAPADAATELEQLTWLTGEVLGAVGRFVRELETLQDRATARMAGTGK